MRKGKILEGWRARGIEMKNLQSFVGNHNKFYPELTSNQQLPPRHYLEVRSPRILPYELSALLFIFMPQYISQVQPSKKDNNLSPNLSPLKPANTEFTSERTLTTSPSPYSQPPPPHVQASPG
jgi:hypothetical protein